MKQTIKNDKNIDRIIRASSPKNGIVFDPFLGSGTTVISCIRNSRRYTGFEINKDYYKMIQKRILKESSRLLFDQSEVKIQKPVEVMMKNQMLFQ